MKNLLPDDLPAYIGKKVAVTYVGPTHREADGLACWDTLRVEGILLTYDDETGLVKIRTDYGEEREVNPERVEALDETGNP